MSNTSTLMAFEGKMEIGSTIGTAGDASLIEAENISEIKVNIGAYTEIEHTLKKHGGTKADLKGMREDQLTFTLSMEYTQAANSTTRTLASDVQIIMTALRSRTPIRIRLSDYAGGEGPVGDWLLWGGETSLDGDEAQQISVTAKPYAGSDAIKWHVDGTIEGSSASSGSGCGSGCG